MYELGHLSQGSCLQDVFAIRIRLTTILGRFICKAGEALSKPIEVWESVALPCECSGVPPIQRLLSGGLLDAKGCVDGIVYMLSSYGFGSTASNKSFSA